MIFHTLLAVVKNLKNKTFLEKKRREVKEKIGKFKILLNLKRECQEQDPRLLGVVSVEIASLQCKV